MTMNTAVGGTFGKRYADPGSQTDMQLCGDFHELMKALGDASGHGQNNSGSQEPGDVSCQTS